MGVLWITVSVSWLCFVGGYVIGLKPRTWRELLFPR